MQIDDVSTDKIVLFNSSSEPCTLLVESEHKIAERREEQDPCPS
jgi:hypothetical protein